MPSGELSECYDRRSPATLFSTVSNPASGAGEGGEFGAGAKALKVEAPELMGQVLNGAGRCARDRRVGIVSRSV